MMCCFSARLTSHLVEHYPTQTVFLPFFNIVDQSSHVLTDGGSKSHRNVAPDTDSMQECILCVKELGPNCVPFPYSQLTISHFGCNRSPVYDSR